MPKRSRSHELEELSVARFNDLLPSKWVSRAKLPDYGIDREVEIFDDEGESTGLMFLVQLRATDDPQRADRVRLEVDEAEYYRKLDLPVAIARYCSVTNDFLWQWASTISSKTRLEAEQTSFTYRFQERERWTDATPAEIRRTLEVRRILTSFPAGAAMPVRLNLDALPAADRYVVARSMTEALAQSGGALVLVHGAPRPVEVLVMPEPKWLAVEIDTVASVTFDFPEANAEEIVTCTLYALARLLQRGRLPRQAEAVARVILARGLPHQDQDLAFTACQALAADLQALVELAIINDFHDQTSPLYSAVLLTMIHAPQVGDERRSAVNKFFAAALNAARASGSVREAAVHYSIGNFYRKQDTFSRALWNYNRARHLRPAYMTAGYFVREVAGLLFEARHYTCAVDCYETAIKIEKDPWLDFLLGDALMFAGRIKEAQLYFEKSAAQGATGLPVEEAVLKQLTCAWLIDEAGADTVPRRRLEADRMMRADGDDGVEVLRNVVAEVDGLNPLARYNLGIALSRGKETREALGNFLTCALVQPGDVVAWANAAICAIALKEDAVVLAILSVAINRAGAEAYDRLRSDLLSQGATSQTIERLDTLALSLIEKTAGSSSKDFTLRMLVGDTYETLTIAGG